jgi:tyrosine-protein kinase Etk/Wzc
MNTLVETQFTSEKTDESKVDLRKLLARYLALWPWLLFSIAIFIGLAFLYTTYAKPMYHISSRVLVNDEKKGGGLAAGTDMLGDLGGLLGGKSTVDNEAEILKTRELMEHVVEDMELNITYSKSVKFKDVQVYKAPFTIKPINLLDTVVDTHMEVKLLGPEKLGLHSDDLDTTVTFNKAMMLPGIGFIEIVKNPDVSFATDQYSFDIVNRDKKVNELIDALTVTVSNKLVTIVDLTFNYPNPKKGEDILNKLIFNYVQGNLKDKNEVADSTIAFIHRRLLIIGSELGSAEGNIEGFKRKNNLADMTEQGKLLVATSAQYVNDLAKVTTQISVVNSLIDYMKDENTDKRVLPSSLMPADMVFSGAVEKYNALLLERGRKLIGLSVTNPIIVALDREITNARADIQANLTTTLDGLKITQNGLNVQMSGAEGQISKVPKTERNYLQLARQQQIKQELYIFLMQKSEETAISKTANLANSKTIDHPKAENKPYSPKKAIAYLVSVFLGLLVPITIVYAKDAMNIKVNSKDDITKVTTVPVLGEISHDGDMESLAVANSSRSVISEQFRALRTNLSFYLKEDEEKVVLVTSSMSGEGKSFVSINLGHILALSGKRVLLMELDLRKPGLATKLGIENNIGFTNFVISSKVTAAEIIKPLSIHENLFMISSGPIPPNPAETLMTSRTRVLVDELKQQFDYIIMDAPPVGLVTDAQLLSPYADICLYLVRQNYTLKEQLSIINELNDSKRMSKLGIVVNDIKANKEYGSGYGGSYVYGNYGE